MMMSKMDRSMLNITYKNICVMERTKVITDIIFHIVEFVVKDKNVNTGMSQYSRTPLIRPPSESHWCGRIRGMVAREGFVYEQKPLNVTRNVVV